MGGEKVRWTPIASDQEELVDLIRRAARRLGHNEAEFDSRHPQLDLQLPDGSRLFAVYGGDMGSGIATQPTLCIRRHRHLDVTTDDLVRLGVMPAAAAAFVVAAFRAGENLIVAGDHNAGKTTFLVHCTHAPGAMRTGGSCDDLASEEPTHAQDVSCARGRGQTGSCAERPARGRSGHQSRPDTDLTFRLVCRLLKRATLQQ